MSLYGFMGSNPIVNMDLYGLSILKAVRIINMQNSLKGVCESYGCSEESGCQTEAVTLAQRYYSDFTAWASANPGYHMCTVVAAAIMSMNLDVGLQWFSLRKMQNYDTYNQSWWNKNFGAGHFVGGFHKCNKDRQKNPAFSDRTFDPHTYFISSFQQLAPRIGGGKLGWDAP